MTREQAKDQIKTAIPCTDFLERSKSNMYCCPYCGSGHGKHGTGAVKYYPDTNTWHCHACDRGGDVIEVYTAATGKDFNAALSDLAAKAGITIDDSQKNGQDQKRDPAESPQGGENEKKDMNTAEKAKTPQEGKISHNFTAYYKLCKKRLNDPAAVSYITGRGISLETVNRFNIGYDPEADPATAPGAMADEHKAHPTPRIIAPCTDDFYIARSIDPETPKKYKALNPLGGALRLFNAKALYSGTKIIFVTEGVFDALSFIETGYDAIATGGKGNGRLLIEQLQAIPTKAAFIIVPDNDPDPKTAGDTYKRAEDLKEQLQGMNLQSIVYNVAGEYHDVNDTLKDDRAAFEENTIAAIKEALKDELSVFWDTITTEAYKPHRTGLKFFDELLGGGIIRQSLLLLVAAPGTGKTTLAQQIAETMAKHRTPVIFFNFEMSREQMLAKAISAKLYRAGGDKSALQILQGYSWTAEERQQIAGVIEDYRREQLPYIRYNPAGTSSELKALLSYLMATGEQAKAAGRPAPAAVIDYLHLIKSSDGLETQELIKQAVTGLKEYAVKYDTFVIGISAANRTSNKTGRLTMESGRDSSNLEYTADYQLSLNYYEIDSGDIKPDDVDKIAELQQKPRRAMILRLLKSRFSQPGKAAQVVFDAAHNIFYGTSDDFIPADFYDEPNPF